MILIYMFTLFTSFSLVFGEFSQFPFGNTTFSIGLTDILIITTLALLFIWRVAIQKSFFVPKIFYLIILFWVLCILSLILNWDFRGIGYFFRFVIYSSSFLTGYFLIKQFKIDIFYKVITLISLILSIIGILQFVIYPDLSPLTVYGYDPHQGRLTSTFLDPNFLAIFLAICIVLQLSVLTKSRLFQIGIIFNLIALYLTFSRTGYITLFISLLVFTFFYRKLLLIPLVIFLVIIYLGVPRFNERINGILNPDKSASERLISWDKGLILAKDNFLYGVGFNNLRYVLSKKNLVPVYSSDGGHAGGGIDSSLLFVLATTGILGLISFISFWISFIVVSIKDYLKTRSTLSLSVGSFLVGTLVGSQFINALFFPSIMFLVFITLGIYYGYKSK